MTPVGKHGDQVFCDSPPGQEHLQDLVPEDRLQLFQVHRRSDPEHALPVEASVRHQDMAVGIESEEVAKGLDGNDGAGDGILLRHRLLKICRSARQLKKIISFFSFDPQFLNISISEALLPHSHIPALKLFVRAHLPISEPF